VTRLGSGTQPPATTATQSMQNAWQVHNVACEGLRKLALLASLMTTLDEHGILELAQSAVPELSRTSMPAHFCMVGGGWWPAEPRGTSTFIGEVATRPAEPVVTTDGDFLFAIPLTTPSDVLGQMLVQLGSAEEANEDLFVLQLFGQQLGAAIDNARRHAHEMQLTADLKVVSDELRSLLRMQEQLNRVAAQHGNVASVVRVVAELTHCPVAAEDNSGKVLHSEGGWTVDLRRRSASTRSRLVERLRGEPRPIREGDEIIALADGPIGGYVLLVLSDANAVATETHVRVLEFATTVLSMILAKSAIVSEAELRLRRDLIEELLLGLSEPIAEARAEALSVDLSRPRRVVVIEPLNPGKVTKVDDRLLRLIQRELNSQGDPGLAVTQGTGIVCLAHDDLDWERIVLAVNAERSGKGYRAGVGSICRNSSNYPMSLRHARQSLRFTLQSDARRVICFDDLGVYRLLALNADTTDLDGFIEHWLGSLLEYDSVRSTELVATLTSYLRSGGSLAATASDLFVHRSTVKYRLERIKLISKHDLTNPETQFSLQLASYALEIRRTIQDPVTAAPISLVSG